MMKRTDSNPDGPELPAFDWKVASKRPPVIVVARKYGQLGNCLYLLLQNPDQMSEVRNNEQSLVNAFEETLRYEPPVQLTVRFVNESMEFRHRQLKRGQMLLLSLA